MNRKISRESQLLNHLETLTNYAIRHNYSFDNCGCDASTISLDLKIERSNVSRILNKLCDDGLVTKIQGRPTLFIHRKPLLLHNNDNFIPMIISKDDAIQNYIIPGKSLDFERYDFDDCIGRNPHESLFSIIDEVKTVIRYPSYGTSILLTGDEGSGKRKFIEHVYKFGQDIAHFSPNKEYNYLSLSQLIDFDQQFLDYFKCLTDPNRFSDFYVIHDIDKITSKYLDILLPLIRQRQQIKANGVYPLFVFISSQSIEHPIIERISKIITFTAEFPKYSDRTLKEKLEYVLYFLQKESNKLDTTISINTGVISCFVMTLFNMNLIQLENEIIATLSHAYTTFIKRKSTVIDVTYDDVSDNILNNINDVSNRVPQLYSLYSLFEEETLYFIPNTMNRSYKKLLHCTLNRDLMINSSTAVNNALADYCKGEIIKAKSLELTMIRSIFITEIYDLLIPLFRQFSFEADDRVIYQLLISLSSLVESIKSDTYQDSNYQSNTDIDLYTTNLAQSTINKLNDYYSIKVPENEMIFLSEYLFWIRTYSENNKISLLIICHGDNIAKNYARYINTLGFDVNCDYLDYNSEYQNNYNEFMDQVILKVIHLDIGKGVIIISDLEPLTSLHTYVKENSSSDCISIYPISLPLLLQVIEKCNDIDTTLDYFSSNYSAGQFNQVVSSTPELQQNNLVNDISEKILASSLIFLDAKKVTNTLFTILMQILEDLNIDYSDAIAIKFIFHSSFMVERSIKNDPIPYRKLNELIKQNSRIFHIIEKNFTLLNNTFGITVSQSEIAFVADIFIDFVLNKSRSD